jgi:hypothetical protein
MNYENRVLSRTGARQLTQEEISRVYAAMIVHTETVCTLSFAAAGTVAADGDPGECGGW